MTDTNLDIEQAGDQLIAIGKAIEHSNLKYLLYLFHLFKERILLKNLEVLAWG